MPIPLDEFTDAELLVFAALAEEIDGRHESVGYGTTPEKAFLVIMQRKQLWAQEGAEHGQAL